MSFWNTEKLKSKGAEIFDDYDPACVKSGAYEMSPRPKALVSGCDGLEMFVGDGIIKINPGQFAILVTREKITMPLEVIGLISIKYTLKKQGLLNVSGFHVDPGFSGHIKFSVFNASPKALYIDPKKPCFQIWFCDMKGEGESYDGTHNFQEDFTAKEHEIVDHEFPSPPALNREILSMKKEILQLKTLLVAIGLAVLVSLFKSAIFGN